MDYRNSKPKRKYLSRRSWEKWGERVEYWKHPTKELREKYKTAFSPETIKNQYVSGTPEGSVSPDGYTLDIYYMSRNGMDEIQSDLIFDYQSNVRLYPEFQLYLRKYKPPILCIWGENDVSFIPEGAKAFQRDIPDAMIKFVDSGHFALESHVAEIGNAILNWLDEKREE